VIARLEELTGRPVRWARVDVRDKSAVADLLGEYPIEAAIHFAGLKAVGESVEAPLEYYENNIGSTLALCAAMGEAGVKRLVFSSSATVYQTGVPMPLDEDSPLGSANPYGWSKLMIEQILRDLAASDPEWSIALLRYFNPIGAHKSGLIGEDPRGTPNNLFPYVCRVASGRLEKLRVFGSDYPTPDGTGVRDYIHVDDLAEGHAAALDYLEGARGADAFNLGTGKGTSVLELVRAFEEASGRKVPYEITGRRPGDIAECYAATGRAERVLGWRAKRTLEDMCRDGWRREQAAAKG
jgi:UDP-glucose 4-epimerase